MNKLPTKILNYLSGQRTDRSICVYILADEKGLVVEWSGDIHALYDFKLAQKQKIEEQLIFLQGLLPFEDPTPLILDSVKFETGRSADIHIIPVEEGNLCILLFDVTESTNLQQALQQKGNELTLLYNQQKRSMQTLKKNYIKLQHQKELIDDANRTKNKFLYHVNQNLKNPLNGISGFLQLLSMSGQSFTGEQREYIREIKNSSDSMLTLINELLNIAQIETGQVNLKPELIAPTAMINKTINNLKGVATKNKLSIISKTHSNFPPLWVEPLRFKQIIANFISNAIKYNREQGCILVNSYVVKKSILRITVKDTGVGIEPSRLENIFDVFHRNATELDDANGSGIGLSVCKQLTELMLGSVGVYSDIGLGSLFWMELPLEKETIRQEIQEKNIQYNALYFDKDDINFNLMKNLVGQCSDYQLQCATNESEMFSILGKNATSVIFINTENLNQEYLHILQRIKESSKIKKIPVIAIFNMESSPLEIKTAMEAGFYDYMIKPFDFNFTLELFDRLNAL